MKKLIILLCLICISCSQEPQTLDELRVAGKNSFIEGDYKSASEYLHKALNIKSSDRDALYYLGQTFQKLDINDSAVYYFKRADILHPNDRELNQAIYISAKLIEDFDNTIKAIDVLIRTGDSPEQYYFELADYNLRNENIIVSFLYLRKMWEEGSDNPAIYLSLGNVSTQIDSVDFAVSIMQEAIEKFGELDQLMTDLAIYIAITGKFQESEAILRKLLKKTPDSRQARYTLAGVLSKFNSKAKKEESLDLYQKLRVEYGNVQSLDSLIIDVVQQLDQF